ncbi:MAG TPA: response regulator [Bryobacteraceae bacterium]|jgi:CheY-like chemotaxis protein
MAEQLVLHVEDDDASYFIFQKLFEEICPDIRLERARDGAEALALLEGFILDPSIQVRLVLLDVFLPIVGGWEVLADIRAAEPLRDVSIVMFSGVFRDKDRARCAALNVEYVEKPRELRDLVTFVKAICDRLMSSEVK